MTIPTTTTPLDPDGLLPVTNLPLGSITAQAEYLTTQHPGELTVAEFHALPERYRQKIVANVYTRKEQGNGQD